MELVGFSVFLISRFKLVLFLFVQIYRLELEQKRLEEDAFVYNWLQQQLKLSPAYKKVMLVLTEFKTSN